MNSSITQSFNHKTYQSLDTFNHVISTNIGAIALTTLPHPVRRSIYSTHPRLLHSPLSTSTTGSNLICGFEAQDFSECFDYVSCSFLGVYRATPGQCMSLRMGSVSRVDCSGALTNMRARMICFCLCLYRRWGSVPSCAVSPCLGVQEFIAVFRKR